MVSQLILGKAKPVTANDRPTVNDDPITHPTAVKQRDMGVKHAMRANFNLTPQIGSPIDSRPFTDPAARPNMNQRTDAGIFPYFHPLAHHCRLMHSERSSGRLEEQLGRASHSQVRLAGNKQRAIQVFHGVRHNQRCCPTIDGQGPVSLMAHKTQFICLSIFQGTQPPNADQRIAFDACSQVAGKLFERIRFRWTGIRVECHGLAAAHLHGLKGGSLSSSVATRLVMSSLLEL